MAVLSKVLVPVLDAGVVGVVKDSQTVLVDADLVERVLCSLEYL